MKEILKFYEKLHEKLKQGSVWFSNNIHKRFNMTPKKYFMAIVFIIMFFTAVAAFFTGHCFNCEGLNRYEIAELYKSGEMERGTVINLREFLVIWIGLLAAILSMMIVPITMIFIFSFIIYIVTNKVIKRR